MKKTRKLLTLLCALAMLLSLAACGTSGGTASNSPSAQTYTVGICQLVQHPALDAATKGFQDALNDQLPGQVTFDYQNASGDSNTCATIINGFVSEKVDLIMANATAALQAASAATTTIPILGTSITNYGVALGIQDFNGTPGNNVSGTSDLPPLDQQAAMVEEIFPAARTVGLLYCSAEANSQYQVDVMQQELESYGYTCQLYTFADSNDLASVATSAAASSDVIYLPTDNTVAANADIIQNICLPAKVPIVAGEEGICAKCGVVTLSISYYDLGYSTGLMAAKVLTGQADISTMPVEYAPNFTKEYNVDNCAALGIVPPSDYVAIDTSGS